MKYMKVFAICLVLISGLRLTSNAQPTVLNGTTTEQASQLVFWYDQVVQLGRTTFLQVTNAGDTPVNIHVQFFTNTNPVPGNPATRTFCVEQDFNDSYTPNDTHVYDLNFIFRNNDPFFLNPVDIFLDETKGFVVITAVDADGQAISHQHLFGTSYVLDFNAIVLHRTNAMGRDAVSFNTPFEVVPDGTPLDGISAGFELIQPEVLKFNFDSFYTGHVFSDIISIAFRDEYDGGPNNTYAAAPGDAIWDNPLMFDEFEQPASCDAVAQNCFFDIGLNLVFPPANPFLDGAKVVCPGNFTFDGWLRIEVDGLGELENELGLVAMTSFDFELLNGWGDASWMYAEPEEFVFPSPTPTPTPTPEPSPTAEPSPTPTPTPECSTDSDCPSGEICESDECIEGCRDNAECPAGERCEFLNEDFGECVAVDGFGSSGSCTTIAGAAPVQLGTAMANILIPLVPAIGIGLRRIFRRRNRKFIDNK
jgi:Cys-rich repeat protein